MYNLGVSVSQSVSPFKFKNNFQKKNHVVVVKQHGNCWVHWTLDIIQPSFCWHRNKTPPKNMITKLLKKLQTLISNTNEILAICPYFASKRKTVLSL